MFIKNINIKSFGKLSNVNLSPAKGLNVIYMPNESGKTTLLSFIKYIFYGLKQKKTYKDLTFKERYMPWDLSPMSGSCEIFADSNEYIIQRSDSDTASKTDVINLQSGTSEKQILNPGMEFFGMGEKAFSDSCLINDLKRTSNYSDSGEIFSLLTDTCNEQNTYHNVKAELQERLNQLNSSKRKSSKSEVLNRKISDYNNQLSKYRQRADFISEKINIADNLKKDADHIKNEINKLYDDKLNDIISSVNKEMEVLYEEKQHLLSERKHASSRRILTNEEKQILENDFSESENNISKRKKSGKIFGFASVFFAFAMFVFLFMIFLLKKIFIIPCVASFFASVLFMIASFKSGAHARKMLDDLKQNKTRQSLLMKELKILDPSECSMYISMQNSNVNVYDVKYIDNRIEYINDKLEKYWNVADTLKSGNKLDACNTIFFTNHKLDDIIDKKNKKLAELNEQINSISHYKNELYSLNNDINDIKNEINRLENEKLLLDKDAEVIECALDILEKSFLNTKETFIPRLAQRTRNIYEYIVNEKYVSLTIDSDFNLFFNKNGFMRNSKYLSNGAYDALYFSLKVAIIETINKNKTIMPVFIDDIFTDCDDERAERMVDIIYDLSEKFQVFMCTCRKREMEFLKDRKNVNIISM